MPKLRILNVANTSFNAIRENKILAETSEFTLHSSTFTAQKDFFRSLSFYYVVSSFLQVLVKHIQSLTPLVYTEKGKRGSREGDRGRDPHENHKSIGCPSNFGQDPLKSTKLPSQANVQCWAIIGTPAKRHLLVVVGR